MARAVRGMNAHDLSSVVWTMAVTGRFLDYPDAANSIVATLVCRLFVPVPHMPHMPHSGYIEHVQVVSPQLVVHIVPAHFCPFLVVF